MLKLAVCAYLNHALCCKKKAKLGWPTGSVWRQCEFKGQEDQDGSVNHAEEGWGRVGVSKHRIPRTEIRTSVKYSSMHVKGMISQEEQVTRKPWVRGQDHCRALVDECKGPKVTTAWITIVMRMTDRAASASSALNFKWEAPEGWELSKMIYHKILASSVSENLSWV